MRVRETWSFAFTSPLCGRARTYESGLTPTLLPHTTTNTLLIRSGATMMINFLLVLAIVQAVLGTATAPHDRAGVRTSDNNAVVKLPPQRTQTTPSS